MAIVVKKWGIFGPKADKPDPGTGEHDSATGCQQKGYSATVRNAHSRAGDGGRDGATADLDDA